MSEYATFSAANAFAFESALSSAPSFPFSLKEANGSDIPEPGLAGAKIWYMVKGDDNDADADALVSLSTETVGIVITDASACLGQIDFPEDSLVETQALKARVYPAFFKVRFASGELRTYGGQHAMTPAGVTATA